MSSKNLTTGYYRIRDTGTSWNGFWIWTKKDWPYLRILFGLNSGPLK